MTEENRILNSSFISIQQESQLVIQENSRLYVELNNLKQQIELLKSQTSSQTSFSEAEATRLRVELTQTTSNLTAIERRLREVQLELSQSKASEVQAKNDRESLRVAFTKQVSELETKISIMSGTSAGASTEISSLRRQYEEQKSSNIHLQSEIGKLQQLLSEAEKRLIEYQAGLEGVRESITITFNEERNHMASVLEQKNS